VSGRRWTEASGYRSDHLRTLAQRVEMDAKEVRTLVVASSAKQRVLAWPVLYRDGAPRPMKMGTIASLWRYDAGAFHALQLIILRLPAITAADEGAV
jgi:hypothetical protein